MPQNKTSTIDISIRNAQYYEFVSFYTVRL